jgi:hypothetical protein
VKRSLCLAATLLLSTVTPILHAQQWTAPTPEELAMTSFPEVPGAPAIYLNREQITEDDLHMFSYYERIKVLTEKGKDSANVELKYFTGEGGTTVDSIEGRTIHPDGTIVPFTGKPYDKLIVRISGIKEKAKVFTLPAVDVGSILEYRYKIRFDDNWFRSPDWYVQSDLFTRKAHYLWHPTSKELSDAHGNTASVVAWTPILPPGATVQNKQLPTGRSELSLDIVNIPPIPTAESMPPLESLSYRVLFYYTPYRSQQEYWKNAGKDWSKAADKFIGPSSPVRDYANSLVAPSDTPDQKARKLYAAIMTMDNTDFSREHTSQEDKAAGLRDIKNSADIVSRKRGSGDQLAMTFVALARAAGLKAYLMGVSNRTQRIFLASYLSLYQIDDDIAIVNIDGKDVFFDPGQRYCAAEHLAWPHTFAGGIRQIDGGTEISGTPAESYAFAHNTRIADLKLDEHGVASGIVTISYNGDSALHWRQEALKTDDTSLREALKSNLEGEFPGGMEIAVTTIENPAQYDQPFKVNYTVKGPIGSAAGKRLLVTPDLFVANEKPRFTEPKREVAVDLRYASYYQDAVRLTLPDTLAVESAPDAEKELMQNLAQFNVSSKRSPTSITSYRNLQIGTPVFKPEEYPDLRAFYTKLAAKDQETIVLTHATAGSAPAVAKPTGN